MRRGGLGLRGGWPSHVSRLRGKRSLGFWWQVFCWLLFLNFGEQLTELFFQPGMQHGVGNGDHSFGSQLSGTWPKEREELGCSASFVLVGLPSGMPLRLPVGSRLGNGLVGSGLIFIQLHDPRSFCLLVGLLDQPFFSGVSGS